MATNNQSKITDFIVWGRAHLAGLLREDAAVVAELISNELLLIDGQLGVEVSRTANPEREIIFTAFSAPEKFPLVRQIVAGLPKLSGWRFVALKPPRGYAFKLTFGAHQLNARDIQFERMPSIDRGIRLVVPLEIFNDLPGEKDAEELAWLIVETGVGEELASHLRHIEFSAPGSTITVRPITELEPFLREMNK